jgi:FkbM family methyltransferase
LTRGSVREQILIDGDIKIELDLSIPYYRALYFSYDLSDMEESILFRKLVGREDVVADAGAHVGYFTLVAAKYARRVLAVEPSPENFAQLERNIRLNPNLALRISALRLGLSHSPGEMTLYTSRLEPHNTSLRPDYVPDAVPVRVAVVTLDSLLADTCAAFIKIDVEGAELDVLRGARQVIARDKPLVLCELNVRAQRAFGRTCNDIIQFLDDCAYVGLCRQEDFQSPGKLKLKPLSEGMFTADAVMNALFVPSDRAATVRARLE